MTPVTNEKVKSLILGNREFKATAVSMLNNLSFVAEKLTINSIEEVKPNLERDRTVLNVVIDGSTFDKDQIADEIQKLATALKGKIALAVFFYTEEHKEYIDSLPSEIVEQNNLSFRQLPQSKQSYVEVFFQPRKPTNANPVVVNPSTSTPTPATQKPKGNVSFFEASSHIKDTIDALNLLANDRQCVDAIIKIGQRFNGLIGTFSFFGSKPGYFHLTKLADAIDTVCRFYVGSDQNGEVKEHHFQFIFAAAKCSFLMLKSLREAETIQASDEQEYSKVMAMFQNLADIKHKENIDQDSIDSLLEEQLLKSS